MSLKTILLTGLGFLFLGLGAIGLLLPLWPTTPFVLVSVVCFSASPRMQGRIMKIPFFREHVENYQCRAGLSRKTVYLSLGWLWGMLLLSMALLETLWFSLLLFFIGIAVTGHILCMAKAKGRKTGETK